MVGNLYRKNDLRRDQGFTIFYIGINFGAFFASIIVGYVGEVYGWHFGFSLAGLGMVLGQIIFISGRKNFNGNFKPKKIIKTKYQLNKIEIDRIKLIALASLILIIFWASFEQAGGLMNIFAYEKTDRFIDFLNFDTCKLVSVYQSFIDYFIRFFCFSFMVKFSKKRVLSSSIFKMAIGIIIMGVGFIFMFFAAKDAQIYGKSPMFWLILAYLFHTIGELCASPVILSFITKLSPKQLVASIMGIYFAAIGLGNKFAGSIGQYSEKLGEKTVFIGITLVCVSVGSIVIFSTTN